MRRGWAGPLCSPACKRPPLTERDARHTTMRHQARDPLRPASRESIAKQKTPTTRNGTATAVAAAAAVAAAEHPPVPLAHGGLLTHGANGGDDAAHDQQGSRPPHARRVRFQPASHGLLRRSLSTAQLRRWRQWLRRRDDVELHQHGRKCHASCVPRGCCEVLELDMQCNHHSLQVPDATKVTDVNLTETGSSYTFVYEGTKYRTSVRHTTGANAYLHLHICMQNSVVSVPSC